MSSDKPLSVDLYFSLKFYSQNCKENEYISIAKKLFLNGINERIVLKILKNSCLNKNNIRKSLSDLKFKSKNDSINVVLNKIFLNDKKSQSILVGNKKRERINNKNYDELFTLIKKLGKWPGVSITGRDMNIYHVDISYDFSQSLLHFSNNQIEKLLPYLLEAVKNGDISPYHFARIYDYYYIKKIALELIKDNTLIENRNGFHFVSKQYFGTYKNNNRKDVFPPVINPENLEERREKACLIGQNIELD
ncbi:hypothetical protein [Chryseobacterium chendengshani]|uniref:hypothetical protein n=1 Tax=Chryseobacterium sp. LJ756 TaxID=2864113 RepID=UPI001C642EBF|nr:hypothetical protein [Chryseobacterium sp. LJ756]MBW7675219.1 hypothetical protein [Chryseobacterium sp. LJ756]